MKVKFSIRFLGIVLLLSSIQGYSENGFVPNKGQVVDEKGIARPEVLFTYEMPGAKMFFQKDKIVFAFWYIEYVENEKSIELFEVGDLEGAKFHSMRIRQMRIDMEFEGADPFSEIIYDRKQSNYMNFYLGHCPEGITNVSLYEQVTYKNIYNNIDLVFKITESGLKYDLILRPGARISDIRFRYHGITELKLNDDKMNVENTFTPLVETIPLSYFADNNEEINVKFNILNSNTFGFTCDEIINDIVEETIIIDPSLTWSTYFERTVAGGVSTIRGNNITDADGNFFYQINTYTPDLPIANPGAPVYLDPSYNPASGLDIYFAKFNVNRELIWSTYLGGSTGTQQNYYDHGLAVYDNFFYITGNTNSNNFPLLNQAGGAYYHTYPSYPCGFLSKFNKTTGQMIHSTYILSYEQHCVAVDNSGNIAVVSRINSSIAPTIVNRAGAYNQATFGGDSDAFIYMFNSSMVQTWGTFFGGAGYTDIMGVTFDNNGNLFLYTRHSSNNAALPLANPAGGAFYQATITDKYDCGISKFNTSGVLFWSTYYGGSGLEGLSYSKARVNDNNDIILTTTTRSTVMPVASQGGGAYYQGTPPVGLNNGWGGDPGCGFYIRFNGNGVRQHASYIGRDSEDTYIQDQAQGNCSRQYLLISTKTFPTTSLAGAYNQTSANPALYNYMAIEFNDLFAIRWASFLQRDSTFFEQFAIDRQNGRLYVTGLSSATDYITANPGGGAFYDGVKNMASTTSYTGAIMQLDIGAPPLVWVSGGGNPEVCSGSNITLNASGSGTLYWYTLQTGGVLLGTGTSYTLNNVTSNTTVWVESVEGGCASSRVPITVTVLAQANATITTVDLNYCLYESPVNLTAANGGGLWSGTGITNSTNGTFSPSAAGAGSHLITYGISGTCGDTTSVLVNVYNAPVVNLGTDITMCTGDNTTLNAGAGYVSYLWLPSGNTQTINVSAAGTYSVTVTDANTCQGTDAITVTLSPQANASITTVDLNYCTNESPTNFTAVDGGGLWSGTGITNSTNGTFSPSAAGAGSHLITYGISGTCGDTASVMVNVFTAPVVNLGTDITMCTGDNTTLNAGAGYVSYLWLPSGNTQTINVSAAGTYSVTVTDANTCQGTDAITVTLSPQANASITTVDLNYCTNESPVNLTAANGGGFWSGTGITNSTNGTFSPSAAGAGSHLITYGISGTCGDTASVMVNVFTAPVVNLGTDITMCTGDNTTLDAGAGYVSYLWLPSGNTQTINVSAAGTYSVTVTDANTCQGTDAITVTLTSQANADITTTDSTYCANDPAVTFTAVDPGGFWSGPGITNSSTGAFNPLFAGTGIHDIVYTISGSCGDSDTLHVTINPVPSVSLVADDNTICQGDSVVVTANGAGSYIWFPSGSGDSNTFFPGSSTTYFVTGTNGFGCSNSSSTAVTVYDLPDVTLNADDYEICAGTQVSLTAGGANGYVWSNSGSGNPINVTPGSTTSYSVTGTDINMCSDTASVTIIVHDLPVVELSASTNEICQGDSVVITAEGAGLFLWSPSGSGTVNVFYPSSTTVYSVTGTDGNGCSAVASTQVIVDSPADATIVSTGPYCTADGSIVLTAVSAGGVWTGLGITNGTSGIFDPGVAGIGTHIITYTITGACGGSDTASFQIFESPDVEITIIPISCSGASDGSIILNVSGGLPPYDYSWNIISSDSVLENLQEGNYSVVVTDDRGCAVTEGVNIDDPDNPCDAFQPHVVVPNVFSPNGDGQNDVLYVRGEGIVNLEFIVYTRWGEVVFETTNKEIGWDGTFQGEPMDPAVFVYYLKATLINFEEVLLHGDITLVK